MSPRPRPCGTVPPFLPGPYPVPRCLFRRYFCMLFFACCCVDPAVRQPFPAGAFDLRKKKGITKTITTV